jgi:hypothetical protein
LPVTLQLLDFALQNEITRSDKDLDSEILIQMSALEKAAYFGGLVLAHTAWVVSDFDARALLCLIAIVEDGGEREVIAFEAETLQREMNCFSELSLGGISVLRNERAIQSMQGRPARKRGAGHRACMRKFCLGDAPL